MPRCCLTPPPHTPIPMLSTRWQWHNPNLIVLAQNRGAGAWPNFRWACALTRIWAPRYQPPPPPPLCRPKLILITRCVHARVNHEELPGAFKIPNRLILLLLLLHNSACSILLICRLKENERLLIKCMHIIYHENQATSHRKTEKKY